MQEQIINKILKLIERRLEGGNWDFKEKWHENKASLLHDIICMANNLENEDAYLIIGVDDSGRIKGISEDPNRLNQENLTSQLKDKKFAGDVRPIVILEELEYAVGKIIDVITVKNTNHTPYYLTESYADGKKKVRGGHIYTRTIDKNTDIDKMADIDKVEYLWKKRFGIDLTNLEKLKLLLMNTKDWFPVGTDGMHSNSEFRNQWYHVQYPEFTINLELDKGEFDSGEVNEVTSDFYWLSISARPLHNTYMYKLNIKYHATVLYSTLVVFADGFRFKRILWKRSILKEKSFINLSYAYVEKDHMDYLIDRWLNNSYETVEQTLEFDVIEPDEPWKKQPEYIGDFNPYSVVPVFVSKEEHMEFRHYLEVNMEELERDIGNCSTTSCHSPEYISYLCNTGKTVVKWLEKFRDEAR